MENKTGHRVPTSEQIQQVIEHIRAARAAVAQWGVHLTAEERKRTTKFREGGEAMTRRVLDLSRAQKLTLRAFPAEEIEADLAVAAAATAIEAEIEGLTQLVGDTRQAAESEAAQGFYAHYNRLNQMSETDAALEADLKPVVEHLSVRRTKK